MKRFRKFVGVPFRKSVLEMYYLYPLPESWADDRGVTCTVNSRRPVTGTLEGARR